MALVPSLCFLVPSFQPSPVSLVLRQPAALRNERAVYLATTERKQSAGARRREKRRQWYAEREEGTGQEVAAPTQPAQHPLLELLRASEDAELPTDTPAVGSRLMVTAVGSSGLGLAVETVACGRPGLVFADEAAYPPGGAFDGASPVAVGDTVPAYVLKVRDDGRLDMCFRPVDARAKLHEAAGAVLAAAHAADDSALPLGDESEPAAVRRFFPGVSKGAFKAAVGHLLRERAVAAPLQPHATALAPDAAWPAHLPRPRQRARLLLVGLPRRARGPVGAAALLAMLDSYGGGALELRGNADGAGVWATLRDAAAAEAAAAALCPLAPPYVLSEDEAAEMAAAAAVARRAAGGGGEAGRRVFVGNLAEDVEEDDLWELFGECGYIRAVQLATTTARGGCSGGGGGACRGFGHVEFRDAPAAEVALRLGGASLRGRCVRVERAEDAEADADAADAEARATEAWLLDRFGSAEGGAEGGAANTAAGGVARGAAGGGATGGAAGVATEALEVAEIEEVLARREVARKARDFETSDRLRQGLWEAGVRVDDAARQWTCRISDRTGRIATLVERWLDDGSGGSGGSGGGGGWAVRGDGPNGQGRAGRAPRGRGAGGRGAGGNGWGGRGGGGGDGRRSW